MNHEPNDENWIPDKKAGYQIPAPSASLREKVLGEASRAWTEDTQTEEVQLWTMPLLRLAASITIAALIVIFAHMGDQYSLARWQPSNQSVISSPNTESSDQWSELHPELMRIRDVAASSPIRIEPKDLMLHLQRLRESVENVDSSTTHGRRHSTEIFLNPRLKDQIITPPEILKS